MENQIPFYFVVELCAIVGAILYAIRYTRMNWKRPLSVMVKRCGIDQAYLAELPESLVQFWEENGVSRAQLDRALRYFNQPIDGALADQAG